MKKNGAFLCLAGLCALFFGCSGLLPDMDGESVRGYGSLTVSGERAVFVDGITNAVVTVAGVGFAPITKSVMVSGGQGSALIEEIPVGKNRVVTFQAFNGFEKISGVAVRAVTDINPGLNSLTVNWAGTAKGNVYNALLSGGVNISSLSAEQMSDIAAAIPSVNAALVNSSAIAEDFKSSSLQSSSNYVLKVSSLSVRAYKFNSERIQVGDPISAASVLSPSVGGVSVISNVAPGTWPVYIIKDGSVVFQKNVTFFPDSESPITVGSAPVTDKIILHAYGYPYIHYWVQGQPGTSAVMFDEGNNWYGYTLNNTSMNMLFFNFGYYKK